MTSTSCSSGAFAELDEKRGGQAPPAELGRLWESLSHLLERHAAAEEESATRSCSRRGLTPKPRPATPSRTTTRSGQPSPGPPKEPTGEEGWWKALTQARAANSDHMAEVERSAFPDFREHVDKTAGQ